MENEQFVSIDGIDEDYNHLIYINNHFFLDELDDGALNDPQIKSKFTKAWLKEHWPLYNTYKNAKLLIFE